MTVALLSAPILLTADVAGGASLETGPVVKDVALKCPEVAVVDFATVFAIFNAPVVGCWFHECRDVRA